MYKKGRKKGTYRFVLTPSNGAESVFIAGDFTGWEPRKMKKQKNGSYALTLELDQGDYQYKFRVDDSWLLDPDNDKNAVNPYGTLNSLATITE